MRLSILEIVFTGCCVFIVFSRVFIVFRGVFCKQKKQ